MYSLTNIYMCKYYTPKWKYRTFPPFQKVSLYLFPVNSHNSDFFNHRSALPILKLYTNGNTPYILFISRLLCSTWSLWDPIMLLYTSNFYYCTILHLWWNHNVYSFAYRTKCERKKKNKTSRMEWIVCLLPWSKQIFL